MELLLGKEIAEKIKNAVKNEVIKLNRKPCLCVLLNKEDSSSLGYANSIIKNAQNVNIDAYIQEVTSSQSDYEEKINSLNNNKDVDAVLITRPLPSSVDEKKIVEMLDENKDVDGVSSKHLGKILCGNEKLTPNTAQAIIELLEYNNIEIRGKKVLVIGRSLSVGKPVAMMLLNRHATVTIAHSKTKNLNDELKKYDIVIAAVGKPHLLNGEDMKEGAIVIDAGIHYLEDEIVGDVKPSTKLAFISKVPGGVGPITSACLMRNVLSCYKENHNG